MKLSIIVPVYNTEKYLRSCLDSLIDTNVPEYEIIAVNDGSTDHSPDILQTYADLYPGILHVVHTENGGLGHARNVGLSLATGTYVLFVDSDDRLSENAISEMLSILDSDIDIIIFDFYRVFENGREPQLVTGHAQSAVFSLSSEPELLFSPVNACNKIWKRSLFFDNSILFPNRLWFEDLATTPNLYLKAAKIRSERKPWYLYLQRRGSITNSRSLERNLEMKTVLDHVIAFYKSNGLYDKYKIYLEYMSFYHEFLTSVVRINKSDPASSFQSDLRDHFLNSFPEYRNNPYIQRIPLKYKVLRKLIESGNWKVLHAVMHANDRIRGNIF